jgi:hypothetical protein
MILGEVNSTFIRFEKVKQPDSPPFCSWES